MKIHSIWDNEGETFDRYTVIYSPKERDGLYPCRGMSEHPFHPQGFGLFGTAMPGEHLGKKITMADLPPDCQRVVQMDLGDQE